MDDYAFVRTRELISRSLLFLRENYISYYEKEPIKFLNIKGDYIMVITSDGLVVTYEEFLDLMRSER